ncbi:MAG: TIM barrel protein [Nanoarchaeota archaeon]|nr:TIM barrel protein [Nanoarchaeota archaeon]
MKSLLFGTSGIPLSTEPRNTANGIKRVHTLGLDSMEIEFVQSVNLSLERAQEAKITARQEEVTLTCHGQYYVNLNAQDPAKLRASKERILKAAIICEEAGVWSLCYHLAFYLGQPQDRVYESVRQNTKEIIAQFKDQGIKVWLRPETGGKPTQFGELNELIKLSQDVEQVLPCIDWAHHHSRSNGKFNTAAEFRLILNALEKGLGRECLDNMHMHIEGIHYSEKGELNHLNLLESDFNYKDCLLLWKEFGIKGVATCESPNVEEDALMLQKYYRKL